MIDVRVLDQRDPSIAESICEVQRAGYAVEAVLIGYDRMPGLTEDAGDVSRLPLTMLGAVDGTELVGVLGYQRTDATVDIDRLVVHPSRFRRGVARTLLEHLHRREAEVRRFEVSTGAGNAPAIALYEAMGFRSVGVDVAAGVELVRFVRWPGPAPARDRGLSRP